MVSRNIELFTLEDLRNVDRVRGNWFVEDSKRALAGRCLLDAIEYIRVQPKFPGQFFQVANSHAIRLTTICLSPEGGLNSPSMFEQMRSSLKDACKKLLSSRCDSSPYYGDDFWDWATILECFLELRHRLPDPDGPISQQILSDEMEQFQIAVDQKMKGDGLLTYKKDEWYGPATAAIAYRVLDRWSINKSLYLQSLLKSLKKHALEPIERGKYRRSRIPREHVTWHLGQVVAQFPGEARQQWTQAKSLLRSIERFSDQGYRAYALARVIQGAAPINDDETTRLAMQMVSRLERQDRPFGEGIIAEKIKASLNVLEALWQSLTPNEKPKIAEMLTALQKVRGRANTGMIFVAIPNEAKQVKAIFEEAGATIEPADIAPREAGKKSFAEFVIGRLNYRIMVGQGKSLMEATSVVSELLDKNQPKWVIMIGVAGSLGTLKESEQKGSKKFIGPKIGDVILATSLAPFRIREKNRGGGIENAAVRFND